VANCNHVCQQASLLNNGKVLITGGAVGAEDRVPNAELYDPATGTFAATGPYVTDTHLYGFSRKLASGKVPREAQDSVSNYPRPL
jgi:hypothetical protein